MAENINIVETPASAVIDQPGVVEREQVTERAKIDSGVMKFFTNVLLLGVTTAIILLGIWFAPNTQLTYVAALIDKHRLLDTTPSPRMIFIGGSNLAFGLDSGLVQQTFGYHVINMGLEHDLGLRYMLGEVKSSLRPGDVAVISPEYGHFVGNLNGDFSLLELLYYYPQALKYFDSPSQYRALLSPVPFQRRAKGLFVAYVLRQDYQAEEIYKIYNRDSFNQYGDLIGHIGWPSKIFPTDQLFPKNSAQIDPEIFQVLRDFKKLADQRGVKVFISFPCVADTVVTKYKSALRDMYYRTKAESNITVLDSPDLCALPLDNYYDNVYHLNGKGRENRTEYLIKTLSPVLQPK
ncbi:MAG: hypothetical protein EXR62_02815 [Chloroflexi bacterium]|nr:hypothetical protein [Chloroflexota bacterium]